MCIRDRKIGELEEKLNKMSRHNDDLSKEVGRLSLLGSQQPLAKSSNDARQSTPDYQPRQQKQEPRCYNCQELGHMARQCDRRCQKNFGRTYNPTSEDTLKKVAGATAGGTYQNDAYIELVISRCTYWCLLDTGSDITILPTSVVRGQRIISTCLLYTSPSPRDRTRSRMPSSA